MRILVTGGAGYLGCCVVPALLDKGHKVRLMDRFCFDRAAVDDFAGHPDCEVVEGDIRRIQETPGLLDDIDAVAHLASLSNDPSCDLDPEMSRDVNFASTRELAVQAIQKGVPRFVLASSCIVYGRGVFENLDEQSPTNPVSTFGQDKLAAEKSILELASKAFEPVVARAATMFGWSPRMRFDLAVNQMVATAARNGRIDVFGGGNQWRPFVHVRDAADAIVALLEAPAEKVAGEVFNVGSDICNYRIRDLAERVAGFFEGAALEVAKDDDDLRSYRVQFDKIRSRLNFRCGWSIDDGIAEVRDRLADQDIDPFDEEYFNVRRMKRLLATPVEQGGEPVAPHFISLSKPSIGEEEEQAVINVLRSGWLAPGAHVKAFERAFANRVGAPHALAVSSCTAALHLCQLRVGVGEGDEVITTPLTWASTANTLLNMGAKPVFADILPDTLNIDPAAIERAITDRTKAIMPVHLAGQPCDLDAIYAIADKHNIPVIEDAAHAIGAAYKGTPIGGCGRFACFSFYPTKNITTIEGGMITLRDDDDAEALRWLANHGMGDVSWNRYSRSAVPAPDEVVIPGYKYLMHNVSAAMGLAQLEKADRFQDARRRLAGMYRTVLDGIDEIEIPTVIDNVQHGWHLMIVRLKLDQLTRTRDEIREALRRENVNTGVHFYGLHLHEYFRKALGCDPDDLPQATRASHEILSLPLHPGMTDKNLHEVGEALRKVIAHARKTNA